MNKPLNPKQQLTQVFQQFITNETIDCRVDAQINRYFEGFILLTRKENKYLIREFIRASLQLLEQKRFPFLGLNVFLKLFEKWKRYPAIMGDLHYLSRGIKRKGLHEDFWYLIIRSIGARDPHQNHKAQLALLTCILNKQVLDINDVHRHHAIVTSILESRVPRTDLRLLKKNLKGFDEHPYGVLFHHLQHMKKGGATGLEISEMIIRHFGSILKAQPFSAHYKAFINALYQHLPPSFMSILYTHEVEKLYFIYGHNPSLFDRWEQKIEQNIPFFTLLKSLFQHFIVSDVWIRQFSYGTMTEQEKGWFAHILRGNNIITAVNLPIALTRWAAHVFRCLENEHLTVTRALIYAGLEAIVEDSVYTNRVVNTIRDESQAPFWVKTMAILHKNGLASAHVIEVMDYIRQKVFIDGIPLDLRKKKIHNLLNDVHNWHEQLNLETIRRTPRKPLPDAGIKDFIIEVDDDWYEISQIRKAVDLYLEGQHLRHCVYTYKAYCYQRRCSIFSLKELRKNEDKLPLITLEIRGKHIVQAKGKSNRLPTEKERTVIQLWAKEKALKFIA